MDKYDGLDICKLDQMKKNFSLQSKEIKKLNNNSIVCKFKRSIVYASVIGVLSLFLTNNPISTFYFLTGTSHIINNSYFPEIIITCATMIEAVSKLSGGIFLNKIHNFLFNRTKGYNTEKELMEARIMKEIEFDTNDYTIMIFDKVLDKLCSEQIISKHDDIVKYKSLKLKDDKINKKIKGLENILIKRRLIRNYAKALSYKNSFRTNREFKKLRNRISIFVFIQSLLIAIFLNLLSGYGIIPVSIVLKHELIFTIIGQMTLLIAGYEVTSHKNSAIIEVLDNLKEKLGGFTIHKDLDILKRQYDMVNREVRSKGDEIATLYYEYCEKQIAKEQKETKVLAVSKEKKVISTTQIAPIDRSLETEPIVAKSRILRREDNE